MYPLQGQSSAENWPSTHLFKSSLDVQLDPGWVGPDQDVLALAVEGVGHPVERVEVRVTEDSGWAVIFKFSL